MKRNPSSADGKGCSSPGRSRPNSFSKADRLLRRSEFLAVSDSGRRCKSSNFLLLIKKNNLERPRIGITVSKKVGNAVIRNRVKRLVREYFRTHKEDFPASSDTVVIAFPGAAGLSYREVESELAATLKTFRKGGKKGS